MSYPSDRRYSQEHEWVQVEGDLATVGITEFAQEELGEVVFVELPEVGAAYDSGDEIGSIESVKAVAEVYTPLSGQVAEVNSALEERPELVNEEPHEGGWLVKVRFTRPDELDVLMDAEAYEEFADQAS